MFFLGVVFLRDQRGFVTMPLLLIFLVFAFSVFTVLTAAAFGAKKNAVMTYQWFGESLEFAKDAVVRSRGTSDLQKHTSEARQWFVYAFSRATESDYRGDSFYSSLKIYPGPIQLVSFRYVPAGTAVPYGGRTAGPGYEAVIKVPVLRLDIPLMDFLRIPPEERTVAVEMRYVGAVKTTAEVR